MPSGRVVVPAGKVDPGQVRSITFPVAGPVTYGNDFGACRDGCTRAHKGNDSSVTGSSRSSPCTTG